ncbi:hypothetical protein BH20ACT17_BH20ACT17_05110 [soil metagenome]
MRRAADRGAAGGCVAASRVWQISGMSIRLRDVLMGQLETLRHEPIDKRIRATLGDATIIDTTGALLVWEPKRVVPTYAVPLGDIAADVGPAEAGDAPDASGFGVAAMGAPQLLGRPVLDPSVPFAVRTTAGEVLELSGSSA